MSWLYHGFNNDPHLRAKQCYYEWHCLVCYLRTAAAIIKIGLSLGWWVR